MGGQTPACCRGFPSCYFHTLCRLGGCGWVEHDARNRERFGTLLGPEKTSCRLVGCFFWWPLPARDRLTHPCGAFRCLVGVVVVVVGSGCGGVLSVA